MGKYLITGRPGSGKTSIIRELRLRGHNAFNTDEMPGMTRLQDLEGNFIDWPAKGQSNWDEMKWNWQDGPFRMLLNSEESMFIGAVTSNQHDYYPLFDKIFALIVSPETLRRNLENHEHDYAQNEIDRFVGRLYKQQKYLDVGAIAIHNNGTIEQSVDTILGYINDN